MLDDVLGDVGEVLFYRLNASSPWLSQNAADRHDEETHKQIQRAYGQGQAPCPAHWHQEDERQERAGKECTVLQKQHPLLNQGIVTDLNQA